MGLAIFGCTTLNAFSLTFIFNTLFADHVAMFIEEAVHMRPSSFAAFIQEIAI
jgi:hypothetical protein